MMFYPTDTGKGKMSGIAKLRDGKTNKHSGIKITTYEIKFHVEPEFGIPGAIVIKNQHKDRFFLQSASLKDSGNRTIYFDCNSWVYPTHKTKTERLFFSNTVSHILNWFHFSCFLSVFKITKHVVVVLSRVISQTKHQKHWWN